MNTEEFTNKNNLERFSFLWSQARLVIAAAALFLGGIPVLSFVLRAVSLYGIVSAILTISWIISGAASLYLLYMWNKEGRKLFGGRSRYDTLLFLVSVISGVNLGLAGLLRTNVGLTISSNRAVLMVVGLIYLYSAWHLQKRWNSSDKKIFT